MNGILGQSAPAAKTLTDLYTAAGAKAEVRVIVANRGAVPDQFRIAVAKSGAVHEKKHYICFDTEIGPNASLVSPSVTLAASDVVRVFSAMGSLSFTATGTEKAA